MYDLVHIEICTNIFIKLGPLADHTCVVKYDTLYIFGGRVNSFDRSDKLFEYDIGKNKWTGV